MGVWGFKISMITLIIIGIILILILISYLKSKKIKLPNVFLVTGGVKTGKTVISVWLSIRQYKKNLRQVKRYNFIRNLVKKELLELPLLYSNIHLRNVKYVYLTKAILERKERMNYKSVVLIDEVSLLADSMLYKDNEINERLMLFVKLFGHETKGGYLIVNTQSLKDCHYAFKRCISSYLWIHTRSNNVLFSTFKVRELMFSSENETSNNFNEDIEKSTVSLFMLNKYYKYYDCFCYSSFTDNLNIYNKIYFKNKNDSLKCNNLLSFQNFKTLKGVDNDEK